MNNLQEILDFLSGVCPRIPERKLLKIIYTIKYRLSNYNDNIILAKTEASKFGISEGTFKKIIKSLNDIGFLKVVSKKQSIRNRMWKVNIYKLSLFAKEMFENIKLYTDFIKNTFTLNVLEFCKSHFDVKFKYGKYKFQYNGTTYIIHNKGKFANKIFNTSSYKIINPFKEFKQLFNT